MGRKVTVTPARVVICLVAFLLAWRVYDAPDDHYFTDRTPQAIAMGQIFAGQLFDGDRDHLSRYAIGDAATKLKTLPTFQGIVLWKEIELAGTPPPHHHLWSPVKVLALMEDRREAPTMLKAFDVIPSIYVMTYVGLDSPSYGSPVKREGSPMMASVMVRYVVEQKDTWLLTFGRKLANAFWLYDKWGERGRFVLADYSLTFNRRDYFDWVKSNGPRLHKQAEAQSAEAMRNFDKIVTDAQRNAQSELEQSHGNAIQLMQMQQETVAALLD